MPRPWYETYPRKYWTSADWRAARKAGAVPPLPGDDVDPALLLLAQATPKMPTLPPEQSRSERRRARADRALRERGVR